VWTCTQIPTFRYCFHLQGWSMFLRNVGVYPPIYMVSWPRTPTSTSSAPWGPLISYRSSWYNCYIVCRK
jgi:hypothetical protein